MERMLALFSAVLLAAPWSAIACSYWTPTPEQSAQGMENAVIAYPIGISNVPGQGADASFRGEFRQTIKWVVLVKWRGGHPLGKIFTTREHIDQSGMCGRQGIFDAKPRLLLFNGSGPIGTTMTTLSTGRRRCSSTFKELRSKMAPNNSFKAKPLRGSP